MAYVKQSISVACVAGLLAGCGGGSTSEAVNGFILEAGDEGSGLPFAGEGGPDDFTALEAGDEVRVRLIRLENVQGEPTVQQISTIETVTLVDDGAGGLDATLTFNGETIDIVLPDEGILEGEGVLADGTEIVLDTAFVGDFVNTFAVFTYVFDEREPLEGGLNSEGTFVAGFATMPDTIADITGSATYAGEFGGFGPVRDGDDELVELEQSVDGELELAVSFDDSTLSGEITNGSSEVLGDFTGTLAETEISGNAFETTFDVTCADFACSSASEIGGAFYGAAAEEAAGVMIVDVTGTAGETALRHTAAAGFITQSVE